MFFLVVFSGLLDRRNSDAPPQPDAVKVRPSKQRRKSENYSTDGDGYSPEDARVQELYGTTVVGSPRTSVHYPRHVRRSQPHSHPKRSSTTRQSAVNAPRGKRVSHHQSV